MEEYIHIGKIVATHGVHGEMILLHSLKKKQTFKNVAALFVEEVKGSHLPYFIVSTKAKSTEETVVQMEGIGSKEQAKKLVGKPVWIYDKDFRRIVGTSSPIAMLGFQLYNQQEQLGKIEEVIEMPHQVLVKITYKNKEALIPIHQETLQSIDKIKQEVHVILPDGLLEIYAE